MRFVSDAGFSPKKEYADEDEFQEHLRRWLTGRVVVSMSTRDPAEIIRTYDGDEEDDAAWRPTGYERWKPDIPVCLNTSPTTSAGPHEFEITSPFFIECKLGGIKQLRQSKSQFLKYKYKTGSDSHTKIERRGDFNVVVTSPELLSGTFDPMEHDSRDYHVSRGFNDLHIGLMYTNCDGVVVIQFTADEILEIFPSWGAWDYEQEKYIDYKNMKEIRDIVFNYGGDSFLELVDIISDGLDIRKRKSSELLERTLDERSWWGYVTDDREGKIR